MLFEVQRIALSRRILASAFRHRTETLASAGGGVMNTKPLLLGCLAHRGENQAPVVGKSRHRVRFLQFESSRTTDVLPLCSTGHRFFVFFHR